MRKMEDAGQRRDGVLVQKRNGAEGRQREGGVSVRKRDGEAARLYLLGRCGQQWMIRYI